MPYTSTMGGSGTAYANPIFTPPTYSGGPSNSRYSTTMGNGLRPTPIRPVPNSTPPTSPNASSPPSLNSSPFGVDADSTEAIYMRYNGAHNPSFVWDGWNWSPPPGYAAARQQGYPADFLQRTMDAALSNLDTFIQSGNSGPGANVPGGFRFGNPSAATGGTTMGPARPPDFVSQVMGNAGVNPTGTTDPSNRSWGGNADGSSYWSDTGDQRTPANVTAGNSGAGGISGANDFSNPNSTSTPTTPVNTPVGRQWYTDPDSGATYWTDDFSIRTQPPIPSAPTTPVERQYWTDPVGGATYWSDDMSLRAAAPIYSGHIGRDRGGIPGGAVSTPGQSGVIGQHTGNIGEEDTAYELSRGPLASGQRYITSNLLTGTPFNSRQDVLDWLIQEGETGQRASQRSWRKNGQPFLDTDGHWKIRVDNQ